MVEKPAKVNAALCKNTRGCSQMRRAVEDQIENLLESVSQPTQQGKIRWFLTIAPFGSEPEWVGWEPIFGFTIRIRVNENNKPISVTVSHESMKPFTVDLTKNPMESADFLYNSLHSHIRSEALGSAEEARISINAIASKVEAEVLRS